MLVTERLELWQPCLGDIAQMMAIVAHPDTARFLAEVARVLRPGGRLAVATSHRCFPTKAIRAFHVLAPNERVQVIARYCELAGVGLANANEGGAFGPATFVDRSPEGADPLWIVTAARAAG